MELNDITITFTELALFCWAIIATAGAFKFYEEANIAKRMLSVFIEDENVRARILEAHAELKAKIKAMRGEA
jgi:hypothetical protein